MAVDEKTLVLCFSGTGNSLYVANALGEKLKNTVLHSIPLNDPSLDLSGYDRIGIVAPLYYYYLPQVVSETLGKLNLPSHAYYFALITRGVPPEGAALGQIKKILRSKGAMLSFGRYVQMPLNDVSFYRPKQRQAAPRLAAFQKNCFGLIKAISEKKKSISLEPLALGAPLIKNLFFKTPQTMDRYFSLDKNRCTKCGICSEICPMGNIETNPHPQWKGNCQLCLSCYHYCPHRAISYKNLDPKKHQYQNPQIKMTELMALRKA